MYHADYFFPYALKHVFPVLYNKRDFSIEVFENEISGIVDTLRILQATCVTLQYKHHYQGTLDKEIQEQKDTLLTFKGGGVHLDKVGLYKALQCISYQIETKHLKDLRGLTGEEQNAMIFLTAMENDLAADIVRDLPAYESAKWEITR